MASCCANCMNHGPATRIHIHIHIHVSTPTVRPFPVPQVPLGVFSLVALLSASLLACVCVSLLLLLCNVAKYLATFGHFAPFYINGSSLNFWHRFLAWSRGRKLVSRTDTWTLEPRVLSPESWVLSARLLLILLHTFVRISRTKF